MALDAKPKFLKALVSTSFDMMKIPPEFTKEHLRTEYGKKAMLFTRLGVFWHVSLHRDGADIYFAGVWPEFARAHELISGHSLVFCHEGNLVFSVEAFDATGCRKFYSPAWGCVAKPVINIADDSSDDDGMQIPLSCCKKKKKKSDMPNLEDASKKRAIEERPPSPLMVPKKEDKKAISDVDQVPYFEKILRPYNFNHKYMSVPKRFCTLHGLVKKSDVVFKNSEGKSWHLKFFPGNDESHFGRGWEKFSLENKLKEGDKCIFQLVAKDQMHVKIVRKVNGI